MKPRVLSGMRPTGSLHLGHYHGVLKNWVKLQHEYECFFFVADWHALTTKWDDTANIHTHTLEIAMDWLAAGVDPHKATLYVQSAIPEIAELHVLFSMFTPVKWVETDPALKDLVQARKAQGDQEGSEDSLNYGMLGYPVLQTADILSVKGDLVPVGKDQEAHLEICRDIAKRVNHTLGIPIFPEPKPLFTEVSRLIGLDGRKMSKSYNNAIYLADTAEETWQKIRTAITDPARVKKTDPGEPAHCEVVYKYYEVFAPKPTQDQAAEECRTATRGCMDCKKILAEIVNERLRPIRFGHCHRIRPRRRCDRRRRQNPAPARPHRTEAAAGPFPLPSSSRHPSAPDCGPESTPCHPD